MFVPIPYRYKEDRQKPFDKACLYTYLTSLLVYMLKTNKIYISIVGAARYFGAISRRLHRLPKTHQNDFKPTT